MNQELQELLSVSINYGQHIEIMGSNQVLWAVSQHLGQLLGIIRIRFTRGLSVRYKLKQYLTGVVTVFCFTLM